MDEWVWYRVSQLLLCFEAPLSRGFLEASRLLVLKRNFSFPTVHSAPPMIFQMTSVLCVNNVPDVHVNVTWLIYTSTENPIYPIMAERYMPSQYKATFRLRIYQTCPNGRNIFQQIYLSTFSFRSNFWVIWGLARWRFWPPVSLVPCSVLLLLTHHLPQNPFLLQPRKFWHIILASLGIPKMWHCHKFFGDYFSSRSANISPCTAQCSAQCTVRCLPWWRQLICAVRSILWVKSPT